MLTSQFLAPAYILLSPGMDYKPNDNFSFFISPATARWVIVKNDSLAAVAAFGVDSGKNSRFEFGAFASVNFKQKISATSLYQTKLDLFSNYLHNPQNISLYWTNMLAVKISSILSMNLAVNIIYDNDIKSVQTDKTTGISTRGGRNRRSRKQWASDWPASSDRSDSLHLPTTAKSESLVEEVREFADHKNQL